MYPNRRSITRRISAAVVLLGLALAFGFGQFSLPIFFVVLAFAVLIGALGMLNLHGIYGGIIGFFWMLMLALFFLTHSWIWFLVGVVISIILGSLLRPILTILLGMGLLRVFNQQSQPAYQPPQQPYQSSLHQPYQPYQQGYQPPVQQPETYQEGGRQHHSTADALQPDFQDSSYASQAEMPQAQYPQMPPLE